MKMGSGKKPDGEAQGICCEEKLLGMSLPLFCVFVNIQKCLTSVKEGGRILIFIEGK